MKAGEGRLKPYEMLKFDALGNQNGMFDLDDIKIVAGKLIDEIGLSGVAGKVGDIAGNVLDAAGDAVSDLGEKILDFFL